jgi:hypothetical protein
MRAFNVFNAAPGPYKKKGGDLKEYRCIAERPVAGTARNHSPEQSHNTGNRVPESRRVLKDGWPGYLGKIETDA